MKRLLKRFLFSLRPVRHLQEELDRYKTTHPPGHYYSPLPDKTYVAEKAQVIFDRSARSLPGIELRENEQLQLLNELQAYYAELPFKQDRQPGMRYWFRNNLYSWSDGIMLYSMIRHFRPRRIIEAGSGFTSALILDTNDRFFNGSIECTFIEPYTERLDGLLKGFRSDHTIVRKFVQDVPLDFFRQLEAGDILFIDSTHVSKAGSDVNYIFFEILPALQDGVLIHFHDIFYPFEYPQEWVLTKGYAWNEDYLLRAFLSYNSRFEIVLFNTFMELFHEEWFRKNMPLCMNDPGGSIWLRKKKP